MPRGLQDKIIEATVILMTIFYSGLNRFLGGHGMRNLLFLSTPSADILLRQIPMRWDIIYYYEINSCLVNRSQISDKK